MKLINFFNKLKKNPNFDVFEYFEYLQTFNHFNFEGKCSNTDGKNWCEFSTHICNETFCGNTLKEVILKACESISKITEVESENFFTGDFSNLANNPVLKEVFPNEIIGEFHVTDKNGKSILDFYDLQTYESLTNKTVLDYLKKHDNKIGEEEFDVFKIPKGLKEKFMVESSDCSNLTFVSIFNVYLHDEF